MIDLQGPYDLRQERKAYRKQRRDDLRDEFYRWVARKLPRRLVRFCVFRVWAHATTGQWSGEVVPSITVDQALTRWKD